MSSSPETPQLPPNLPPFPPVPDGFDRWVYRGTGWLSKRPVRYSVASAGLGEKWHHQALHSCSGGDGALHYIEAVKDSPAVEHKCDLSKQKWCSECHEKNMQWLKMQRAAASPAATVAGAEESAFESWLKKNSPSGDAESVQRQWLNSSDYADAFTEPPVADSLRETPRTDQAEFTAGEYPPDGLCVNSNFARTLERELAEWEALAKEYFQMVPAEHGEGEEIPGTPDSIRAAVASLQDEWDTAERRLTAAQQDSERLAEALRNLPCYHEDHPHNAYKCRYSASPGGRAWGGLCENHKALAEIDAARREEA